MINSLVNIYYPVIIAYIFYYFFVSFAKELPWKYCNPLWASANCTDPDSRSNSNGTFNATGEYDVSTWSMTTMLPNSTNATNAIEYAKRPAQEFWEYVVILSLLYLSLELGVCERAAMKPPRGRTLPSRKHVAQLQKERHSKGLNNSELLLVSR